ncbi:hypothetical protein U9M48_036911 [Paspalum notatum var. saurae]|uniref:Tf2-1-like SH3-like domain-containing protein n=1 Tax=Paspalum notatum var. saurae TaxID=547442 RepID=A0AAQ3XAJ1_PASNO
MLVVLVAGHLCRRWLAASGSGREQHPPPAVIRWLIPDGVQAVGAKGQGTQKTSELVAEIRQHMLTAQSQQKSYVGDHVLLKVSPTKGTMRFGPKGKLIPRYIGPFTIVAWVGKLAYRLELPESMKGVHSVFHISMLRKYLREPKHRITLETITIEQDLTFEARPVTIFEESDKVLRHRILKYVKILWTNQTEREATWELESQMRLKYPELFTPSE